MAAALAAAVPCGARGDGPAAGASRRDVATTGGEAVPLGVYWSWERIERLAAFRGMAKWSFVRAQLATARSLHVNTVWVTNLPLGDLRPLLEHCGRERIRLIAALNEILYRNHKGGNPDRYYAAAIPAVVDAARGSEALWAWVLEDEPAAADLRRMERMRETFARIDPGRVALVVTVRQVTPLLPPRTQFGIYCSDLYPFFGPGDPNGPHSAEASRRWYRVAVTELIDAARSGGAVPWVMTQCFCEVWGPWRYDKDGDVIALPGSYAHWVNNNPAHVRWQIWEAVRAGARGYFCFTATPPVTPGSEHLAAPDVPFRDVLVKQPFDAGPAAVINPDGSVSRPGKAMGEVYSVLAPQRPLIARWVPCPAAAALPDAVDAGWFADPLTDRRHVVVVNRDFQSACHVILPAGEGAEPRSLTLSPGDGRILPWDDSSLAPK